MMLDRSPALDSRDRASPAPTDWTQILLRNMCTNVDLLRGQNLSSSSEVED